MSAEILRELGAILEWIDEVPVHDMTTTFYIHAFNELETNVRALLESQEDPRLQVEEPPRSPPP